MINKTILTGRLTKDAEIRMSTNGTAVCRFSLAVDRYKEAEGQPSADFIPCIAFGSTAEYMGNYIKRGYLVSIEGHIQTGSYDSQATGQKVFTTDVIVERLENLTPRSDSNSTQAKPQAKPVQKEQPKQEYSNTLDISTDDLPFSLV